MGARAHLLQGRRGPLAPFGEDARPRHGPEEREAGGHLVGAHGRAGGLGRRQHFPKSNAP
eukprot:8680444-Heterocapsa_arctica.AAC.1